MLCGVGWGGVMLVGRKERVFLCFKSPLFLKLMGGNCLG